MIAIFISAAALIFTLLTRAWNSAKDGGSETAKLARIDGESVSHTRALGDAAVMFGRQDEVNKNQGTFNQQRLDEERRIWAAIERKQDKTHNSK